MDPLETNDRMRTYFRDAFKNGAEWADIKNQIVGEFPIDGTNTLESVLEAVLRQASDTPPKLDFSGFELQKALTAIKNQKLDDAQHTFASYCVAHIF